MLFQFEDTYKQILPLCHHHQRRRREHDDGHQRHATGTDLEYREWFHRPEGRRRHHQQESGIRRLEAVERAHPAEQPAADGVRTRKPSGHDGHHVTNRRLARHPQSH